MRPMNVIGDVGRAIASPVNLLYEWGSSRIRRSEATHNAELQMMVESHAAEMQMKVESHKAYLSQANAITASRLRMEEAEHQAELEIKLHTEIDRIKQWAKDKEFHRMVELSKAVVNYRKALTDLQTNTIRSIGSMSIELRDKAQNLILSKTREFMLLQSQAQKEAEGDFERIMEKFSGNERIFNIMIDSAQKKQANIVNATARFMNGLNDDIKAMNQNIDSITKSGQAFIEQQISNMSNPLTLQGVMAKSVEGGNVKRIEDIQNAEEV